MPPGVIFLLGSVGVDGSRQQGRAGMAVSFSLPRPTRACRNGLKPKLSRRWVLYKFNSIAGCVYNSQMIRSPHDGDDACALCNSRHSSDQPPRSHSD
eukprot:gene3884-13949_t